MPVDECLHKFGFSDIYIYIYMMYFQVYCMGILYFCIFIPNDPQRSKQAWTNEILGHKDVSSISFP